MKQLAKTMLSKDARLGLRRAFYYGTRYHCSICGSQLRTMLNVGAPFPVLHYVDIVGGEQIKHDACPVCFSTSRTRLVWEYLHREVCVLSTMAAVFHVAPEYALQAHLSQVSKYTAVDLDPGAYNGHQAVDYCDITNIGCPDNAFDMIICNHVLEHVPRDDRAIRELHRILRPGGIAILQVPIGMALDETIEDLSITDPEERERCFGQRDHVRIYGPDYPHRLEAGGFYVEVVDPVLHWGDAVIADRRLNRRERLFVGRK